MKPDLPPSFEGMPYAALRRYVSGASDAAERQRVESWAAASAGRRAYLAALGRTWLLGEGNAAADAAWAALTARLDVPPDESRPFEAPWEAPAVEIDVRRRGPARRLTGVFDSRRRWRVFSAAAAVALLVAVGTFLLEERGRGLAPSGEPPLREVA